jgi:hypothetical protein
VNNDDERDHAEEAANAAVLTEDADDSHELVLVRDDKYAHLFYSSCTCGQWSRKAALPERVQRYAFNLHRQEADAASEYPFVVTVTQTITVDITVQARTAREAAAKADRVDYPLPDRDAWSSIKGSFEYRVSDMDGNDVLTSDGTDLD